jgi:hypothetical protein
MCQKAQLESTHSTSLAPSVFAPVDKRNGTMLAEIFMVHLEARARLANEPASPGGGRFVPFVQGSPIAFKEQASRLLRPMVSRDGIEPSTY